MDGYVDRSIQADFLLITTEVKRDFDRVTRPLLDKILQVLFCADLSAIFTPLVSNQEKFQVEDGTGGGQHMAVRVEFTSPADDLAVISPRH